MKVNWKEWGINYKLMIIGLVLALLSMFLPWVSVGGTSILGLQSITVLLIMLWVYPILQILNEKPIKKIIGIILSIASAILGIIFIIVNSGSSSGPMEGIGAYVYVISSILFIIGIFMNKKIEVKSKPAEVKPLVMKHPEGKVKQEVKPEPKVEVKQEVKPEVKPVEVKKEPAPKKAPTAKKEEPKKKATPKKKPTTKKSTTKSQEQKKKPAPKKAPTTKKASETKK